MMRYIIGPDGERHGPFIGITAVHGFIASRWPGAEQGVDWNFEGDEE